MGKINIFIFTLLNTYYYIFGRKLHVTMFSNLIEPLGIVWTQLDPIKDLILVRRMVIILGGFAIVFTTPNLFSSVVSNRHTPYEL